MNRSIPLVDSNILISFFIQDEYFETASKILSKRAHVNDYVFTEVVNFIHQKQSAYHAFGAALDILERQDYFIFIPIETNTRVAALDIMQKYLYNRYAFTDSLLLAQAEVLKLKLITTDVRMQNYRSVNVIDPFS